MPIIRKLASNATSDLEEKADETTKSATEPEKSPENAEGKSSEPEAKEDFPLPTSIEDEKQQIKSIHDKEQLEEGATWYLINTKWWNAWKEHVRYAAYMVGSEKPGAINNSDLVYGATGTLRSNLLEEYDLTVLPAGVWKRLHRWYGGGPELARRVISTGTYIKRKQVEIYPLKLKIIWNAKPAEETEMFMSRCTRMADVKRQVCARLGVAEADAKLWNYFAGIRHEELDSPDVTLDDARISDGQKLLLEQAGVDTTALTSAGTGAFSSGLSRRPFDYPASSSSSSSSSSDTGSSSRYSAYSSYSSGYSSGYSSAYDRATPPGQAGLVNLGNTCFMNSALQCLSHSPELVEFFLSDKYKEQLNPDNPLGMQGKVAREYADLVRTLWSGRVSAAAPRDFKYTISSFAPQFAGYAQHDSQELLNFLLDGLHEDLNRIRKKPYVEQKDADGRPEPEAAAEAWGAHRTRNDSVVVDLFQGQFKSTLVCPDCHKVSVTFDPFMSLSLPLPDRTEMSLRVFFVPYADADPVHALFTLPKTAAMKLVKQRVAELFQLEQRGATVFLAEVYQRRFHKVFRDDDRVDSVAAGDLIFAYEIPSDPPAAADQPPLPEQLFLPVFLRAERPSYYSRDRFDTIGFPFFLRCTRTGMTAAELRASLAPRLRRYVKAGDELPADGLALQVLDQREQVVLEPVPADGSVVLREKQALGVDWLPAAYAHMDEAKLEPASFRLHESAQQAAAGGGKKELTLASCLNLFITPEKLSAEDPWFCPQCKAHKEATKKFDLWRLPKYLIVQLKRFQYTKWYRDKLDQTVDFPLEGLDLSPYVRDPASPSPLLYDLYAVSNHFGGLGGGHYTAYARLGDQWYDFDDSHVSTISASAVRSSAAYVLFYRRRELPSASTDNPLPASIAARTAATAATGDTDTASASPAATPAEPAAASSQPPERASSVDDMKDA